METNERKMEYEVLITRTVNPDMSEGYLDEDAKRRFEGGGQSE